MSSSEKSFLFTVGIGNTNVSIGVFDGKTLIRHWRLTTELRRTSDEVKIYISQLLSLNDIFPKQIMGIMIASDVPAMTTVYRTALKELFQVRPFVLTHLSELGLENCYEHPEQVGSDRLANAVAGKKMFGLPLIIVDIGTAITLDVLSSKNEYLGGVILPGPQMSAEALYQKAARLPQISFEETDRVIGQTTEMSIRSGLFNGVVGAVDYLVEEIQKETGEQGKVVSTGGLGEFVVRKSNHISEYVANLNLIGLQLIWEMNQGEYKSFN